MLAEVIVRVKTRAKKLTSNPAAFSQNRLSVFPVPDGDMGDNMVLTLKSTLTALEDHAPTTFQALVDAMERQIETVQSGEVTVAVRATRADGLEVSASELIGLQNGQLVARGGDIQTVVLGLLEKMDASEADIVTLYYGQDVQEWAAEYLADIVRKRYPEQDVDLAFGGQPHYAYILSAE